MIITALVMLCFVAVATVQLELASVSADETEGILEVNVEVTLTEGSEIDLQIPVFTQSDSSKLLYRLDLS